MNPDDQPYFDEIVYFLMARGTLTQEEAEQRINDLALFDFADTEARDFFYHEIPYYYAMEILHGRTNPHWFLDRALWPPPHGNWPGRW